MKTIEQAAYDNCANVENESNYIDGFTAGVEFAQRWILVEYPPEEGSLVLSAPCENPQPHEIALCWFKYGRFISKTECTIFSETTKPKMRERFSDTTHWRSIELK